MKLCKDCKHYVDNYQNAVGAILNAGVSIPGHLCAHPELVDPVTGGAVDAYEKRANECGKEAHYWEAK